MPASHLRSLPYIVVLVIVLAGCTGPTPPVDQTTNANVSKAADDARDAGDFAQATEQYLALAQRADTTQQSDHWRLQAALMANRAGNPKQSRALIDTIDRHLLTAADKTLLRLARAQNRSTNKPLTRQLAALPTPSADTPDSAAARIWAARARMQFAAGQSRTGIKSLVQRDSVLDRDKARYANNKNLFRHTLALRKTPEPDPEKHNKTVRGWLQLAQIARTAHPSADARERALRQWIAHFPDHPANGAFLADELGFRKSKQDKARRLTQKNGTAQAGAPSSQQVALALPLSGRYENAAQAIRDGYQFAADQAGRDLPPPLIWDSHKLDSRQINQRASERDVGVIVGPLRKDAVANLASQWGTARVIALNHTTTHDQVTTMRRRGFYEFGLAPADEAQAAARRSLSRDWYRALVLVPDNERGQRTSEAFQTTFQANGGTVVAHASYQPDGDDHGPVISRLLAGYNTEKARNPRNVDVIFVAASPQQGRLIQSQLRYNHATDLPMVATSLIYSGSPKPQKDVDLDGVYFVDMPWRVGTGDKLAKQKKQARDDYPKASRYARLFALGMDSHKLASRMVDSGLDASVDLTGASGRLQIDTNAIIHRRLAWARFVNGRPKLLSLPSNSQQLCCH